MSLCRCVLQAFLRHKTQSTREIANSDKSDTATCKKNTLSDNIRPNRRREWGLARGIRVWVKSRIPSIMEWKRTDNGRDSFSQKLPKIIKKSMETKKYNKNR